jgi:DNA polymerase-3 subunit epsilon
MPPLDAVIGHLGPPTARVAPLATSLSARAAELLAAGPRDPLSLMRVVCRADRLRADAAARIAEVLLGSRPDFVQLDDDRWALVRDGAIVTGAAGEVPRASMASPAVAPTDAPAWPASVQDAVAAAHDASTPDDAGVLRLSAASFAVVDVETTGSQPGLGDRVTEIAIVPVDAGQVGDPWSQLVHPGRAIPPMITALTGISDPMVADAPAFGDIASDVVERLEGRVFTAHNATFDRRFVDAELARARGVRLDGSALCTVLLTRRLVPALSRRSLDRVAAYFGVRIAARHRAAGDAHATAEVLVRLLGIAEERGLTTWPDLMRALGTPARHRAGRPSALPGPVREDLHA